MLGIIVTLLLKNISAIILGEEVFINVANKPDLRLYLNDSNTLVTKRPLFGGMSIFGSNAGQTLGHKVKIIPVSDGIVQLLMREGPLSTNDLDGKIRKNYLISNTDARTYFKAVEVADGTVRFLSGDKCLDAGAALGLFGEVPVTLEICNGGASQAFEIKPASIINPMFLGLGNTMSNASNAGASYSYRYSSSMGAKY